MKIRLGFVANSSTTSFTCDVCGEVYTGMDACPRDFECTECEHEHVFCNEHAVGNFEECEEDEETGLYPASCCPICQWQEIDNQDVGRYLLKEKGVSREDVFAEIKKINKRRKVLRDEEYVQHVCTRFGLSEASLLAELKERFGTYDLFRGYLKT